MVHQASRGQSTLRARSTKEIRPLFASRKIMGILYNIIDSFSSSAGAACGMGVYPEKIRHKVPRHKGTKKIIPALYAYPYVPLCLSASECACCEKSLIFILLLVLR